MKTSFFKKILPMLAILFAVGGAFGTYAMNHSVKDGGVAPVQGYIKNNLAGTDCTASIMCSDQVFDLCTSSTGTQLWAKNAQGRCVNEIYKPH